MGKSILVRTLIVSIAVGCFVASSLSLLLPQSVLLSVTALLLVLLFIFRKNIWLRVLYVCTLFLWAGFTYTSWYISHLRLPSEISNDINTQGLIISEPVVKPASQQFVISVKLSDGKKHNILVRSDVYPKYSYGDVVKVDGALKVPEVFDSGNGKAFDYPNYLLMKYKVSRISDKPKLSLTETSKGNGVVASIYRLKYIFENAIDKTLPEPEASLSKGILIGSRASFTKQFEDDLKRSGTSHIVAISGYNVTIMLMIFFLWVRKAFGFKSGIILGLSSLLVFVILTGANASIVRASIMGSLVLLAKVLGRPSKLEHSLFVAAFVMVALNPLIVRFDSGFQLSFMAVLGLIYFVPLFESVFEKISYWEKIPQIVKESVTATLGAQLTTLPLLLISFGQVSLIAPVVNAIVLPLIPLAMLLSFLSASLAIVIPGIGNMLSVFPLALLRPIVLIIEGAAKLPFASFAVYNVSGWWMIAWLGIVTAWINRGLTSKHKNVKFQILNVKTKINQP